MNSSDQSQGEAENSLRSRPGFINRAALT